MAVLDYICARPDRFVNAQFNIPWDGACGGSCPDFLVLNFRDKTAYIVEVTTGSGTGTTMSRVRERETRWISPVREHLRKLNSELANWDVHVTLFVRDEQVEPAKRAVESFRNVSVIPLSRALFSWNWDWQSDGLPNNELRDPERV
jgi:hypothetical protein